MVNEPKASSDIRSAPPAELLNVRGLCKRFGPVRALDCVDFSLAAGEIHALMGENGAGKSTLIKCLTGVHRPDAGEMRLAGRAVQPTSPRQAESLGISTVYQEINLIPHLSVAENVCLGREPTLPLLGKIRWGQVRARARVALRRLGLALDVRRELGTCSIAVQQLVAIARALDIDARVLILDEPTSSLDRDEAGELFEILRRLRSQHMGIVFITHYLDQVYAVADRITVLRDGRLVGVHPATELPRARLVSLMVGRELEAGAASAADRGEATAEAARCGAALLEARGIGRRGAVEQVDLAVWPGDALGLAGLLGSGRSETAQLLFGAERIDRGGLWVDGRAVRLRSPRDAIRLGIALTPEDRKRAGLIPNLPVRDNMVLALQARRGVAAAIPATERRAIAERFIQALAIKTPGPEAPVSQLSGGNQQKVLLARWLAMSPRVLILDEPTRGIDVAAKAEILRLVRELGAGGLAIVFISSELEEVLRVCRRLIVLRDRRKVAELGRAECRESAVLAAIAGEHA